MQFFSLTQAWELYLKALRGSGLLREQSAQEKRYYVDLVPKASDIFEGRGHISLSGAKSG
jgi:hypothetical protein